MSIHWDGNRTLSSRGGRNLKMLAGGLAAGIVGGRLLPALLMPLFASNRVRAGGDPFALLIADHRRILSLLDEMANTGTESNARRARLFLMLKRKLAKHAMAEEDVVYPIVRHSAEGDERKHLYDEHADMKILLYQIEDQLKAGEDWSGSILPLRELIRRHANEEENTIFPELRSRLEQAELPKISGQISREEALIV